MAASDAASCAPGRPAAPGRPDDEREPGATPLIVDRRLENGPHTLKLGLAGGPLLVAIVLGRIGRVGPVLWYMPGNVNVALRELGMTLFLAAVGLKAGAHLVAALASGTGPMWFGVGVVVTVVPMLIVGAIGRALLKLDYPTLSGVLAGSMTDPPALAFAQGLAGSDAPAVGYAAVYPLTMVLRIVTAQLLVLLLS